MTKHVPKVSTIKHNGIEDRLVGVYTLDYIIGYKIKINLFNYKAGSLAS
jgi:hypothetical protein